MSNPGRRDCVVLFAAVYPLMADTTIDSTAGAGEFESIFEQHRPRVFRFILASIRDVDVADTLTQDCFLKAYQGMPRFRGECSMETWLLRIAVNLVRDYARNRRLQFWKQTQTAAVPTEYLNYGLADQRPSVEVDAVLKERVRAVWQVAERLPERQRTVFLLRFVEDLNLMEIAAATGLKEGTIKTHLSRALQAVRAQIGLAR